MSDFLKNKNISEQGETKSPEVQTAAEIQEKLQDATGSNSGQQEQLAYSQGEQENQPNQPNQQNHLYTQQQQQVYTTVNYYGQPPQAPFENPYTQQNQYFQGQYPPNSGYPNMVVKPKKAKQTFEKLEYILWVIALALGIFLDRTIFAHNKSYFAFYSAFFWLGYLLLFTIIYWAKVKKKKLYWLSSFFIILLCSMSFLYDGNGPYIKLASILVIPGTLLLTFIYGAFSISCYKPLQMLLAWIEGLFVLGLSKFSSFSSVVASFFEKNKGSKTKSRIFRIVLGFLIALPIVLFLGALLAASDEVFHYYLTDLLKEFSLFKFIWNILLIFVFSSIIFSFLLNVKKPFNKSIEKTNIHFTMDPVITYLVLSLVLAVYALFCWVQFAYLFAGQGLPEGITYSEYAVKGFGEMIFVCTINLVAFGIVLLYTKEHVIKKILLVLLLAFTGVMLTSAGVRLHLYIASYDLTWLRLLSGWFIVFMAMVLIICMVRLFTAKLPAVTVCFFVLLAWFSMLGISNPQKTIIEYNITHAVNPNRWLRDNEYYLQKTATAETVMYLLDNGYGKKVLSWNYSDDYTEFLIEPYESPSFSGNQLRKTFPREEYFPERKTEIKE